MRSILPNKTAYQQTEMKEIVQMHTSATDHSFKKLKVELSKHLMLDKRLFLQTKTLCWGGMMFPKSLQDLRSPSILASGIPSSDL